MRPPVPAQIDLLEIDVSYSASTGVFLTSHTQDEKELKAAIPVADFLEGLVLARPSLTIWLDVKDFVNAGILCRCLRCVSPPLPRSDSHMGGAARARHVHGSLTPSLRLLALRSCLRVLHGVSPIGIHPAGQARRSSVRYVGARGACASAGAPPSGSRPPPLWT